MPSRTRAAALLLTAVLGGLAAAPRQPAGPALERAAWCWTAAPALGDAQARARLIDFLVGQHVTTVWVQVATEAAPGGRRVLAGAPAWRAFIADARRKGLRVDALDGDPVWALKAFHAAPLGVVDAIAAYNRAVGPDERFGGIHFDIEPYLLVSWRFRASREQLLRELIDLAAACQQRARDAGGLQFGMDLPYWWDSVDERTGRPITDTLVAGVRQSALRHLLARLDVIGIMNYRNTAAGPDGLIANGAPLLAAADAGGRARVFMGVETTLSAPADVWFVAGPPVEVTDERLQAAAAGVGGDGRFRGFRVRVWDDGVNGHVGLVAPDGPGGAEQPAFREALVELGRRFAASADLRFRATADVRRDKGMFTLGGDPEYRNLRAVSIRDDGERLDYLGFVATSIMLPKITFFGLPLARLDRELADAAAVFSTHRSFAGFAIHDTGGLRAIVESQGR